MSIIRPAQDEGQRFTRRELLKGVAGALGAVAVLPLVPAMPAAAKSLTGLHEAAKTAPVVAVVAPLSEPQRPYLVPEGNDGFGPKVTYKADAFDAFHIPQRVNHIVKGITKDPAPGLGAFLDINTETSPFRYAPISSIPRSRRPSDNGALIIPDFTYTIVEGTSNIYEEPRLDNRTPPVYVLLEPGCDYYFSGKELISLKVFRSTHGDIDFNIFQRDFPDVKDYFDNGFLLAVANDPRDEEGGPTAAFVGGIGGHTLIGKYKAPNGLISEKTLREENWAKSKGNGEKDFVAFHLETGAFLHARSWVGKAPEEGKRRELKTDLFAVQPVSLNFDPNLRADAQKPLVLANSDGLRRIGSGLYTPQ